MEKEIVLSPEELYYLGTVLQAKYIDYAYVAAMDDIGQNYSLFEKEAQASIVNKGILTENFSGETELEATAASILKPIFFGEIESSIDICELGEEKKVNVFKFHFYDGMITMVTSKDNNLLIKSIDKLEIKNIVENILPDNYKSGSITKLSEIDTSSITRFIAAKSIIIEKRSVVKTYIETANTLYQEKENGIVESVTKETFVNEVFDIVKGV